MNQPRFTAEDTEGSRGKARSLAVPLPPGATWELGVFFWGETLRRVKARLAVPGGLHRREGVYPRPLNKTPLHHTQSPLVAAAPAWQGSTEPTSGK